MLHSRIDTQREAALRRLDAFDLDWPGDPDFAIAFEILGRNVAVLGEAYAKRYLEVTGWQPNPERRARFVDGAAAAFKARYDVKIGPEWIYAGEKIALDVHRQSGDATHHLAALSIAQVQEIIIVFKGIDDTEEAIRIAAKMSRLQALDAEILLTSVRQLQTEKHFDWVQTKVGSFNQFLGKMDKVTAEKSDAGKNEAEKANRRTSELSDLSGAVVKASEATADAMEEAASDARQLGATMDQMMLELREASKSIQDAIEIGRKSVESVNLLSAKSTSIQSVAALIEEINDRSDVMALNASIEAARAGVAGAGFGVVATELRDLSEQTASATADIFSHVDAIKDAREEAYEANRSMLDTFASVSRVAKVVHEKMAVKSQAVAKIAERVDQTANNAANSRQSIATINELASELSQQVEKSGSSLNDLSQQIAAMRRGTGTFLADLSARAKSDPAAVQVPESSVSDKPA